MTLPAREEMRCGHWTCPASGLKTLLLQRCAYIWGGEEWRVERRAAAVCQGWDHWLLGAGLAGMARHSPRDGGHQPQALGSRAGGRWYLGTLIGGRGTGCPGGFTAPAEPVGRRRLLRCLWGKHQPPRSPWVTALTRLLLSGFNRVVVFLTDPWACLSSPDGAHVLCEQHVCPGVA